MNPKPLLLEKKKFKIFVPRFIDSGLPFGTDLISFRIVCGEFHSSELHRRM